jgi:endonuclease G, mitochondrial
MERLEKIKEANWQLANEAAATFAKELKTQPDLETLVKRNIMHSERESFRSPADVAELAKERIIGGQDESKEVAPNAKAKKWGRSVARLIDLGQKKEPKGFGTSFLIAPNILMTNNHVFQTRQEAQGCAANFIYERNEETNKIDNGIVFRLKPEMFFYTFKDLDFSLVYVEGDAIESDIRLTTFNVLPLIGSKGKVKTGSRLNIIQFPNGGVKKYTTDENFVKSINDELGIIYYTTDTDPGSSGSPCFNEFWEVAALHYTSVPKTNSNGDWLCHDGTVWNKKMSDNDVDWIANAGKSISKIADHLASEQFNTNDQKFINSILQYAKDPLRSLENDSRKLSDNFTNSQPFQNIQTKPSSIPMAPINLIFNGPTNVYITNDVTTPGIDNLTTQFGAKEAALSLEKKERFDENYSNRKGYSENFIRGFKVPVPIVNRKTTLYREFNQTEPYVLKYHHYSLVMNKNRRMLAWAAANVDYNPDFRDERGRTELGNGAWRYDQRIPEKYQITGPEFYDPATLIDKGHIIRRDDNCWAPMKNGESNTLGIEYANADTFHWTNCTPQHEAFNRDTAQYTGIGLWGILENEIKKQLDDADDDDKDYGQKACVLAGPIFKENDPEYMDIQYPLSFWKVFAIKSTSEGNLAYGFILSQSDKIDETGVEKEAMPRFGAKVRAMQVSLRTIEKEAGITFDQGLHDADVKGGDNEPNDLEHFKPKK